MEDLEGKQKIILTESMMSSFIRNCIYSMEILSKNENIADWFLSFYVLAITSIESSAKLVLLKRMRKGEKSFEEINTELKQYGHNIEKLYSKEVIGNDFLSFSNILKVDTLKEGEYIFRYNFYIKDIKDPIQLYDSESIKYGLMTRRENGLFVAYQTSELLKLCNDIFETVKKDLYLEELKNL